MMHSLLQTTTLFLFKLLLHVALLTSTVPAARALAYELVAVPTSGHFKCRYGDSSQPLTADAVRNAINTWLGSNHRWDQVAPGGNQYLVSGNTWEMTGLPHQNKGICNKLDFIGTLSYDYLHLTSGSTGNPTYDPEPDETFSFEIQILSHVHYHGKLYFCGLRARALANPVHAEEQDFKLCSWSS